MQDKWANSPNIIPSPSSAIELNQVAEQEHSYNLVLAGLFSHSEDVIKKKAKELGIEHSLLRTIIPAEGIEVSLGWSILFDDKCIYHTASATQSNSGSPIFVCNVPIKEFMEKSRLNSDHLQRENSFRHYLKSLNISLKLVALHSRYNQHTHSNIACSVLSWFDSFYDLYCQHKNLYSHEEQYQIEQEKIFFDEWKLQRETKN